MDQPRSSSSIRFESAKTTKFASGESSPHSFWLCCCKRCSDPLFHYYSFAISYHHGTRQGLLFPTSRLNSQAAPILTINPAQIVLNALRSMMHSRVGSNVDLSPAWHPIILFWKMLKDIKAENLEDPLSALSPRRFKADLSHSDTSTDDLMAMKEYLMRQTVYENNKISYMRDASKFILEKYFSDVSDSIDAKFHQTTGADYISPSLCEASNALPISATSRSSALDSPCSDSAQLDVSPSFNPSRTH